MRTDSERLRRVVADLTTAKAVLQSRVQVLETSLAEVETTHSHHHNIHPSALQTQSEALQAQVDALQTQADVDAVTIHQAQVLLAEADTRITHLEQQVNLAQESLATKSTEAHTLIFQIMALQSTNDELNASLVAATLRAERELERAEREIERAKQASTAQLSLQRSMEDLERTRIHLEHQSRVDQDTIARLQHQVMDND